MGRSKGVLVPSSTLKRSHTPEETDADATSPAEETNAPEETPAPKEKRALPQDKVDYEKLRQANIESNEALLQSLLGSTMKVDGGVAAALSLLEIEPAPAKKKKAPKAKPKPKPKKEEAEEGEVERPSLGTRRSARNAGRPATSYKGDGEHIVDKSKMPRMVSRPDKRWDSDDSDEEREGGTVRVNKLVGRVHDPKTFGLIPGVKIGSWWETRAECSAAAIHAPFVAGISGGPEGAYSVALSGGYDDDVDLGEAFTYTGSGGRDLKGTKQNPKNLRTAPQSCDQTFDNAFNKALQVSSKTGKPVRVIRGFKLQSKYAPKSGYRYDGLYVVERAWMAKGNNPKKYMVCKYAFRRIPGQPPIPERRAGDSDDEEEEEKEEEDVKEEESEAAEEDLEEDNAKDEEMTDEDLKEGAKQGGVNEDDKEVEGKEQSAEEDDAVKKEEGVKEEEDEPKGRSKRARATKDKDEPAVPVKRPRGRPAKKK